MKYYAEVYFCHCTIIFLVQYHEYLDFSMLNQLEKVELPLPQLYRHFKKNCKIVNSILFLRTLENLSLLLEVAYDQKVARESMYLSSLGSFLIISTHYLREAHQLSTIKILQHPLILSILTLSLPVLFRFPYSSAAILVVNFLLTVLSTYKYSKNILLVQDPIFVGFMSGLVSIQCLFNDGFLNLSLQPIFFLLKFFITSLQLIALIFLLKLRSKDATQQNSIYRVNIFRYIYVFVMFQAILISLLISFSKKFDTQNYFIRLLPFSVALSLTVSITTLFFLEEITLLCSCPIYTQEETIFRVHYREYCRSYEHWISQRTHQWDDQICLLCDKIAKIVVFPCGHLTLCADCQRRVKEGYQVCLICGEEYERSKELKVDSHVRQGYDRKIFIEKKLLKNQERIFT